MKNITLCFLMLISVHLYGGEVDWSPGSAFFSRFSQDTVVPSILAKGPVFYDSSGNLFEGAVTDYYDENRTKTRITGRFKKGIPVDTVKEYYANGLLKSLYYPYKRKYKFSGQKYAYSLLIEYDEQGNRIRYRDDNRGLEILYRSDQIIVSMLFYSLKNNRLKYYVEYYPDGIKKTIITNANKYDYDENGRLRRHWVRKSERVNKKYGAVSATFYFEEFDVCGKVSKTGRFYSDLCDYAYWYHIFPEFPKGMGAVPVQDFREVVYPTLNIKDVYRWDYVNKKTTIIRYKQRGDSWVESKVNNLPRIENS